MTELEIEELSGRERELFSKARKKTLLAAKTLYDSPEINELYQLWIKYERERTEKRLNDKRFSEAYFTTRELYYDVDTFMTKRVARLETSLLENILKAKECKRHLDEAETNNFEKELKNIGREITKYQKAIMSVLAKYK